MRNLTIWTAAVLGLALAGSWVLAQEMIATPDPAGGTKPNVAPGIRAGVPAPPNPAANAAAAPAADQWRYRWFDGRWWYWTPQKRRMWYTDDGHWVAFDPSHAPPAAGYSPDNPAGYDGGYSYPGYYSPGYYAYPGPGYWNGYYPGVGVGVGPYGNVSVGVGRRVGVDVGARAVRSALAAFMSVGKPADDDRRASVSETDADQWRLEPTDGPAGRTSSCRPLLPAAPARRRRPGRQASRRTRSG